MLHMLDYLLVVVIHIVRYDLLFIDEGQQIPDLGIHLKILHDEIPELRIIVTGSSSFDLATKIEEPISDYWGLFEKAFIIFQFG